MIIKLLITALLVRGHWTDSNTIGNKDEWYLVPCELMAQDKHIISLQRTKNSIKQTAGKPRMTWLQFVTL